jgi:mono/diheme cytochrome c family protein/plastocyanin
MNPTTHAARAMTATLLGASLALALLIGVLGGAHVRAQEAAPPAEAPEAIVWDLEALTLGKLLYEETAGGVGCAYCHGLDGLGEGTAGVEAPNVVGAQEAALRSSLAGAVPLMGFIKLTESEFAAVLLYLKFLKDPDPTLFDGAATVVTPTVNIYMTEEGFEPSSVTIEAGQRVRLVLRNRTLKERHYRVIGMPAASINWMAVPRDRWEVVDDEEHLAHTFHHEDEDVESAEGVFVNPRGGWVDHDHSHALDYIPWRGTSPSGIKPNGREVHGWTFPYSSSGNLDVMTFIPLVPGTYTAFDPVNPSFVGEIVVR